MVDKELKEDYYIRIGIKFKGLLEQLETDWENQYGFKLSILDMCELLTKKIEKAGGIKI
jgi:hypothetical protein